MTKPKSIPRWAFVVAGVFFILIGGIETIRNFGTFVRDIQYFNDISNFRDIWILASGLINISYHLPFLCLGIIAVGFRRNNTAIPIAMGFALFSQIFILFWNFVGLTQVGIVGYSSFIEWLVYITLHLSTILLFALIILFSVFNLKGKEGLCKAWFIPVVFNVFLIAAEWFEYLYSYFDFYYQNYSSIAVGIKRYCQSYLWYYISDILYFIAFAFLCYGFSRVLKKVKAGESSELTDVEAMADAYGTSEPIVPSGEIKPPYAVQDDAFSPYSASPSQNTAPQPAPKPEPQPAVRPQPQPVPPAPQPAVRPQPQPTVRPQPQPMTPPVPQPTARPEPRPAPQPVPTPPTPPAPQPAPASPNSDTFDQLRKYKQLFDEGVITQEEFEAKKRQLMDL